MNILHLANVLGKNRGGGVHEVAFNFWHYQSQFELTPSSIWFPGWKSEVEELGVSIKFSTKIRVLDTYFNPNFGLIKNVSDLIQELKPFDIIHQHGVWLPLSRLTTKAKINFKTKVVIQPHGYLEPYRLDVSKAKKKLAYQLFERKNLRLCDVILACSIEEMQNLRKFFPEKDIAVISNGIPTTFFTKEKTENYFGKGKYKNRKNLLFLSRVHPTKGLDRLLSVFSRIDKNLSQNWNLIIAGMGDPVYIGNLKKYAEKLGLADRVFFEGSVFGQDKTNILSSADLFILPTFSENFGIVIAEALAKGLPAITTKSAPWSDLEKFNCGLWVDDSEEGIRMGLEKAMKLKKNELKEMDSNGKKLVAERYLWENIVKQTIELYNWMLTDSDKPAFVYKGDPQKTGKSIY